MAIGPIPTALAVDDAANREACERTIAARPMLVDVASAKWLASAGMKSQRILLYAGVLAVIHYGTGCTAP